MEEKRQLDQEGKKQVEGRLLAIKILELLNDLTISQAKWVLSLAGEYIDSTHWIDVNHSYLKKVEEDLRSLLM